MIQQSFYGGKRTCSYIRPYLYALDDMRRMADGSRKHLGSVAIITVYVHNLTHQSATVFTDVVKTAYKRRNVSCSGFCRQQRLPYGKYQCTVGADTFSRKVFNSFYAWGTTNIIIRGLSLIVFPLLLGADLTSRIPESLTEFICVVVTYPIYLLVHRFIGYEYLQVEEKERLRIHFTPIVIGVSFAFLSYGLLNDFMPYFASIWPVEVVNNYAKLVVLLATGAFFIVVSYANQWIKDELFLELKEEQERHFQSLQESSRHILHLYQDLYRDGVPKVVVPKKVETVLATSQEGDSQNLSEEEVPFSKVMPDISNLLSQLLRSVIESKYMEFHAVGVDFIMEVPDPISPVHIDVVDLSAVLTTFLDNALLRAHGQENSLVRLTYYQSGEVQVLSVETTLSQDSAEAPHEAYENHLSNNEQLEDIMERYPKSKLSFKNDKFIYRQQFEY